MSYTLVPRIGTGSAADPYRPDLPDGIAWVGQERGGQYLVKTAQPIPGLTPLGETGLADALQKRRLSRGEVERLWWVG